MDCVALMVGISDGEEIYVAIEMDIGNEIPPQNNPRDIRRCVSIFNENKTDDIEYIDMYGIVKNGIVEEWEEGVI